ncbi:hypothetical protein TrST_g4019 [Triparma strigata]|uniref:Uncharacterized protein n=1 Tax=Triparma strigata TaxID=1606541 RepID=A0A9W7BWR5_9STRA|nr:hypothetical protein TrST_g4019 [Triparma strigata]
MFSKHDGGSYKPREMFGSNTTILTTVTVAGIETHVMSTLTSPTGVAARHKKPDNKHSAIGLSARMEASTNAMAKAELERITADDFDPAEKQGPVEGAALPGLTPAQLKMYKKKTPRAVSHPGVVKTYREGDPRSPEMRALKAEAQAKAAREGGQAKFWDDDDDSQMKDKKKDKKTKKKKKKKSEEDTQEDGTEAAPQEEKKEEKRKTVDFRQATPPTDADDYARDTVLNHLKIETGSPMKDEVGSDFGDEDENWDDSYDLEDDEVPFTEEEITRPQHQLLGDFEEEDDQPHFQAGGGGFMELAPGVKISNPLVAAADETEGRSIHGEAPDDLLCEECEKKIATHYSEIDEELLCWKCCSLLYLPTSGGMQHEAIRSGEVRPLTGFDRNRLYSKVVKTVGDVTVTIPEFEVSEEEMAKIRGFAPDKPSAIEAPDINLVSESAAEELNHEDAKFNKGDVCVFTADDFISERENDKSGHAMWRGKQLLGIIMAVPNSRHGAFGTAHRRIAGNEMMYRVKVVRYVTGEYDKYPDRVETRGLAGGIPKGGGVKILTSSEMLVDPLTGEMIKAPLVEEKNRAWRLDKEIENLELERVKAKTEYGDQGMFGSPGSEERDGNWGLFLSKLPVEELEELISEKSFRYSVVLLPEHDIQYPSEAQRNLVQRRKDILLRLMKKLDWQTCSKDYRGIMTWWWHSVVNVGRAKDYKSVVLIQSHIRRFLVRFLLEELTAIRDDQIEWVKWWRIHRNFPYETDPANQTKCYNVRGTSIFLPTLAITNRWTDKWMKATNKMVKWMNQQVLDNYRKTFRRWKAEVNRSNEQEAEKQRSITAEEERLWEQKLLLEQEVIKKDEKPWHPAIGIVNIKGKLTPLPPMYCKYKPNGSLEVTDYPKYNSFKVRQGGPTDTSAWLIPGQLLMGCYPDGKARMKGRQPVHSDSLAQILFTGTGGFINLMEEEEEKAFEIRKGDHLAGQDIKEKLRRTFMSMQSQLSGAVKRAEQNLKQMNIEVSNLPRYASNDSRYEKAMLDLHEAVARQGLAIKSLEKAKADQNHFAKEFKFERFAIRDGCACDDIEQIITLCESIEQRLRDGERIFIFDRLGHGRVGLLGAILLGRIYGCTAEEALFRVQMYHDSKVSVKISNRSYSCPQTVDQVAQVRAVLARGDAAYGSLVMKGEDATIVYDVKRRVGLPALKRGVLKPIDHEAIWDAEIQNETPMDDEELEESIVAPRHHCNATPGFGVERKEPEYEWEVKGLLNLVLAPTMMSLAPLTTVEEIRERDDVYVEKLRKPLIAKDGTIEVIPKNFMPKEKRKKFEGKA